MHLFGGEAHRNVLEIGGTVAALVFYAVLVVMYLRRGAASGTDRRPTVWLAAGAATFSPFLIPLVGMGGAGTSAAALGSALVVAGVGLSIWSLLSLRTNISVVPQARELSTSGPYRWFRHPLYVFEYVSAIGLVLLSGGGLAWLVLLGLGLLQVLRARWEEKLLREELPGYAAYAARTPGFS
jgi:protein-S-isoprenylcysteine O-methyltransferase Ste14